MEIPQQNNSNRTCPRCGNKFFCSSSAKCWCYEISLSDELLALIEKTYDSCLCPECLAYYAESKQERML